ncbi:MAG: cation diffusion facilitator family transporter [Nitrospira sp.]|jgi:cobalt-zinc-cadmium efflux system protein|nr:cation diffusion facilitator family transporter [Nitrospira sp.]
MTGLASFEHLRSRLYLSLGLNALIITAEFIGGFILDSIGLMSDAGHNLVDQGSLFLALYAHILTKQPASAARTFGYHRAGVIAAFLNSFILVLTAIGITLVGIKRLLHPVPVDGGWIMGIAAMSFAANLSIALLLQHGAKDDLNIRSAFWHMLGDAWVSLGVVLSGGAIMLTGWTVLDPLISLLVVGAILHGAWPLFRESLDVLLESTPPTISASHVATTIESLPGVKNVHDLHIWAVEPRLIMLTCHVLVDGNDEGLTNALLHTIRDRVSSDFGIHHMTIQMGTHCCEPDTVHCDLTKLPAHCHPLESHTHHH